MRSAVGVYGIDHQMVDSVHSNSTGPVVVLVGVPGAGKTTVGRALGARLGVGFRDTDADVEATTGREIADIFVESGEPEFRRLEAAAVAAALAEHPGVLALGGGAVTDAGTRALLVGRAVVWLRVGLAAASQRAGLSGARPVLLGNVRAQMKALMDARAPLYAEVANVVVDTDELTVEETIETILAGLDLPTVASPPTPPAASPAAAQPRRAPQDRPALGAPVTVAEAEAAVAAYPDPAPGPGGHPSSISNRPGTSDIAADPEVHR